MLIENITKRPLQFAPAAEGKWVKRNLMTGQQPPAAESPEGLRLLSLPAYLYLDLEIKSKGLGTSA